MPWSRVSAFRCWIICPQICPCPHLPFSVIVFSSFKRPSTCRSWRPRARPVVGPGALEPETRNLQEPAKNSQKREGFQSGPRCVRHVVSLVRFSISKAREGLLARSKACSKVYKLRDLVEVAHDPARVEKCSECCTPSILLSRSPALVCGKVWDEQRWAEGVPLEETGQRERAQKRGPTLHRILMELYDLV